MQKKRIHSLLVLVCAACGLWIAGCGRDSSRTASPPSNPAPISTNTASNQPSPATESPSLQTFLEEASQGNVEALARAITRGMGVNTADPEGRTALMMASFDGHSRAIELLLDRGGNPNLQDASGRTALMYAASGPNPDAVRLLLDRGAETDLRDGAERFTALMFAAAEGQTQNVRMLLQAGADPLLKDIDGDTARNFAVQRGQGDVVSLLEEAEKARTAPKNNTQ